MRHAFTEDALHDMAARWQALAERNPVAARRVLAAIHAACECAACYPDVGHEGRVAQTRELLLPDYPYLVPYRVDAGILIVLRVFHTLHSPGPAVG